MSGLLALLDDVVALAKLAAVTIDDAAAQSIKVGSKTAGVVIDDAAVTPRYVTGLASERELPIVGRIAFGSLKNKLLFLLPAALLLSIFLPQAITPILTIGGLYLAYEGFEKVLHWLTPEAPVTIADPKGVDPKTLEDQRVAGAIRTDFILSAEIMAIALANIESPDIATKAAVLAIVALLVTAGVYGVVALIVKADDLGFAMAKRNGAISGPLGRALVFGMPPFLKFLSVVGTLAMLWVAGDILIHGLAHYGVSGPEHFAHAVSDAVQSAMPVAAPVFGWIAKASISAVVGIVAGAVVALLLKVVMAPFGGPKAAEH